MAPTKRITNAALFICDIQEKFRPAIWEYPKVIATAQKMLKACHQGEILSIPAYATTQLAAKLGDTCSELAEPLARLNAPVIDKSAFSMWVPGLKEKFHAAEGTGTKPQAVVIVGIETHICVTQTALDLLAAGHKVYILADGVSSCNSGDARVALARLRQEGAVVTTSESFIYEVMGDAKLEQYVAIPPTLCDSFTFS
ncbi:MAG: hypothetical protein M4579_001332 [Chaenotheca gracillima]|nr:MAG: hypothetical protein M4579_001332 [Chaenotheca gracillima]